MFQFSYLLHKMSKVNIPIYSFFFMMKTFQRTQNFRKILSIKHIAYVFPMKFGAAPHNQIYWL